LQSLQSCLNRVADVDDLFGIPHDIEDRFRFRECIRITTDHDRERAVIAPMSPPLTGASSIVPPSDLARSASRRATPGAMLLMSMMIVPGWSAVKTPFGPSSTSSTSGESGTIVMMTVGLTCDVGRCDRASGARRDKVVDRSLTSTVDD
jgi:hypothetical protein